MPALLFFTILIFMVYRGYCFSLNTQLARAGIPQQAKWQGFLFLFQLGRIPIKFEFQSF